MGAAAAVVDDSGAPGVGSGATGEETNSLSRAPRARRQSLTVQTRNRGPAKNRVGQNAISLALLAGSAAPTASALGQLKRTGSRASLHLRRAEDISSTCRGHHPSHTAPKRPHIRAPSLLEVRTKSAVTRRHFDVPHVASGPAPPTPERRRLPCPPVGQPRTRSGMALPPSAVGDPVCFAPRDGGERARQPAQPWPRVKCGGFPIVSVAAGGV